MTLEQVAGGFGDGVQRVVLVVSADARTVAEVQAALRPAGHGSHVVSSACAARCMAAQRAVNLAVLDATLADGDAVQLGRSLYETQRIPFVQLVDADQELRRRAIAAGAFNVLAKPVDAMQLGITIDVALVRAREAYKQERVLERLVAEEEVKKVVALACGMAMERHGVDEHEALEMLSFAARARQARLADFCRQFLDNHAASGLLRDLGVVAPRSG